jgi:hypothetical protein
MRDVRIAGLYRYPVKSARGEALASARLAATGLEHDREWLVVDDRGIFQTQRERPRLATLSVATDGETWTMSAPGQPALRLPREFAGDACRVRIWRDRCAAIDAGDAAASWLSAWLGGTCRLVRFDPAERRLSSREWTGDVAALNQFSDGFPVLVLGNASLADLAARAGRPFPVERFRPNLVLDGLDAYGEDRIDELAVGAVRLRLVKPCTRCVITATDQACGERDGEEPLRTLRSYRYDARLQGVTFAQNAVIVAGIGATLAVGDRCVVTLRDAGD